MDTSRGGRIVSPLAVALLAVLCTGPSIAAEKQAPAQADESAPAAAAAEPLDEFLEQSKQPFPWLAWGTDLRLREVYFNNAVIPSKRAANHERHFERYRWRIWSTVTPPDVSDVEFNWRIVYEPRPVHKPEPLQDWIMDDILFDRLNLKLKRAGGLPLTVTAGRQDLTDLGNRWLIFEGTPLDGSRTVYFDAFRFTYEAEPIDTTFDVIWVDQDARGEHWFDALRDRDTRLAESDERALIAYARNRSLDKTQLDGYFIFKREEPDFADGNRSHLYTFGARAKGDLAKHWGYDLEFALQYGEKNAADVRAGGFQGELAYHLRDSHRNQFRIVYEYLSGDDPGTDENEAFDTLWGRFALWSELLFYTYIPETRAGDYTNLHRLMFGHTCHPTDKIELRTDYHLLFADENAAAANPAIYSTGGYFRGQLLALWLKYRFNKHVSGHLVTEFFFPGNFYENFANDPACFLRYQLEFTW